MNQPPVEQKIEEFLRQLSPYTEQFVGMLSGRNNTLPNSRPPPQFRPRGGLDLSVKQKIPIDMVVDEKKVTIYADLPGVDRENIEIDVFNDKLTIIASRQKDYTPGPRNACEILEGKFERVINLGFCITKKETVNTLLKNGLLKIEINKLVEEQNRFSVPVAEELD